MEYADSLVTGYKLQDGKIVTNSTKGTSASQKQGILRKSAGNTDVLYGNGDNLFEARS